MDDAIERKKLIEYQSSFMRKFAEIKELMEAGDKEMDLLDKCIQRALNNAFIMDSDIYGIKKYEPMLNILPDAKDTQESRKSRILIRWNDTIPYTWQTFLKKLDLLCDGNYEAGNNFESGYEVYVTAHLGLPGQIEELERLLEKILPANLVIEASNIVETQTEGRVKQAAISSATWNYEIS